MSGAVGVQWMNRMTPSVTDDREGLEADGLGGFASGTASGIRTRRYHALLLTATTPPTGRVVLVNGFDAWLETPSGRVALDWTLDLLFAKDFVQFLTVRGHAHQAIPVLDHKESTAMEHAAS